MTDPDPRGPADPVGCDDVPRPTPTSGVAPRDPSLYVDEYGAVEWIDNRFPMFFIAMGLVAALAVGLSPAGAPVAIAVGLVVVSISPWALSLVGVRLPDWLFVSMVLVPVGVLIVLGEPLDLVDLDSGGSQLVLMLAIGIAGQIAAVGTPRQVRVTAAAGYAIIVTGGIVRGSPLDFLPWIIGITLAIGGAKAFRRSLEYFHELRLAQQKLSDQHMADERRRIAREVHDIVAHTMSVTMLHLTAARMALGRDPDAAEEALVEAERHGRASMQDIRRVVRLLREEESVVAVALPDDTDIPALVERYRAAGSDVDLRFDGAIDGLAPASRLAVYRIVQESLSNASRHGHDPVEVVVANGGGRTEIDVTNAAEPDRPRGTGAGLTGMRERAEALGGTFSAGLDDRRWRVHARIPS